jgi:hypothetical protein
MQFQQGKEKTGGRAKGTRNKRTNMLIERAEKMFPDLDPVLGLMQMAHDELDDIKNGNVVSIHSLMEAAASGDDEAVGRCLRKLAASKQLAADCLAKAAPYLHAKLKAVDMHVDAGDVVPLLNVFLSGQEPKQGA